MNNTNAGQLPLITGADPAPSVVGRPTCGELMSAGGERLPLKALSVETDIVGVTASSTVRQRFVNTGDATIEATYVFPLPARAGVTDFVATLAGRRVVGVLKERGEARVDYEEALAHGQRAAIVEEDRSDVFSVRVGNLGPGEEAVIELRLTGPLPFEDGEATFRFPLVVAPRYTTGTPLPGDQTGAGLAADTDAVPDASRVTPPRLLDTDERPELAISVRLDGAGLAVSRLRSSLPTAVLTGAAADGTTQLRVEPGARADRDFVLRFDVDRAELSTSAVLVPDPDGAEEGTWSVTLLPPIEPTDVPRDVVVLLDRSGSMSGWKMVAARRAAGRIVDMLDSGDRFCVLAFDDRVDLPADLPDGLVAASDRNRFAAASWLGALESRGGTEMAEPLHRAARLLRDVGDDRRASIVLVTDGQITGEDQLLRSLAPHLGSTRVYCVGVDRAVNAGFLERLAGQGNGRAELVESEDRLDEVMTRLARTIGRPALTGIRVCADGIEILDDSVSPARPADAFAGVPCVISGRYRGRPGAATLRVEADESFTAELPAHPVAAAAAVRTIWARAVVRDLEDAYAAGHDDAGLTERLVAHSKRFGVLSRFTAFVAVDPAQTDAGPLIEVLQPVEPVSGWAVRSAVLAAPPVACAMPAPAPPAATAVGGLGGTAPKVRHTKPVPPTPSLPKLLKQIERGMQVRRSGLDRVLAELTQVRDATFDQPLRAALDRLCDVLARFLRAQNKANTQEVLLAAGDVKRVLEAADSAHSGRKWRFWA